ncbi:MAG: DUF4386 family protein [Deinococcota bacterium]
MISQPSVSQRPVNHNLVSQQLVSQRRGVLTAIIMGTFALITVPSLILLPLAGWPDFAQGASATDSLPTIMANIDAFRLGYLLFIVAGLLYWPATFLLIHAIKVKDTPSLSLQLASGLALASAATRSAWYAASMTVFPILNNLYQSGDAATQAAVDVVFIVLNDTLSSIQEDIGVNLIGAAAGILIAVFIWQTKRLPRWLAVMGIVGSTLYVLSSAEILGIDLGGVGDLLALMGPTVTNFWYLFMGIAIWWKSRLVKNS